MTGLGRGRGATLEGSCPVPRSGEERMGVHRVQLLFSYTITKQLVTWLSSAERTVNACFWNSDGSQFGNACKRETDEGVDENKRHAEDYELRFLMSCLPGFCGNNNTNLEKPGMMLWPTVIVILVIIMGLLSFPFHTNCWEIRINLRIDLARCHHISFQNGNCIVIKGLCSIRLG